MASPPQLVVSAGNLRFLQPPGRLNLQPCPWPRPRSRACPLCSSGVTRIQCLSLRAPPQCAISPGPPQVPASNSAAAGEPAWCLPLFCAVRALTTSAPRVAAGAHTRSALSSGPRKASGLPQPTGPPKAATSIPFLPPLLFRGRPLPVAQSLCASAVRDLTWAPWPPPAPPPLPESLLGASRCSVPSVHSPLRLSAPRKAAASVTCSDPQTPKSPTGRFGTPGVAAGAHTRSAPSSGLAPQPGPHSARGRHDFDFLFAGPSGAKSSGVRHLRVLGHAPDFIRTYGKH
ncbi:hypothetical protein NDU88_003153 [Pleurodeles waltl]|uniref:Uncharacterized protein n=1 Tax=Pleurodeles waltl TaxID=8319 RepID=A0AAV7UDH8_PLEWA|nr:hypothetical protein NDU88_003153 [Pleurodeles waltl]